MKACGHATRSSLLLFNRRTPLCVPPQRRNYRSQLQLQLQLQLYAVVPQVTQARVAVPGVEPVPRLELEPQPSKQQQRQQRQQLFEKKSGCGNCWRVTGWRTWGNVSPW